MSLSGGLGAVTSNKNVALLQPAQLSCEKLCAVRSCNNQDLWIITKDWNSNVFRCWSVDATGIGNIQSWSSSGVIPSGITQSSYGQLKASPDGTKLLACYYGFAGSGINKVELYDFDSNTGFVTNAKTLSTEIGAYGCEFSPNGQIVYASTNSGNLIQWDISSNVLPTIQATRTLIFAGGPFIGSLQLGPDNKIYVSRNSTFLSVINFPNIPGLGCGYSNLTISLSGRNSRMGLPNFAPVYLPFSIGPIQHN
jgi:WD40 repeat protein